MQTALFRVLTRVAVFISHSNNYYTITTCNYVSVSSASLKDLQKCPNTTVRKKLMGIYVSITFTLESDVLVSRNKKRMNKKSKTCVHTKK